jgi:Uncharacterized protein conserved in bacteria
MDIIRTCRAAVPFALAAALFAGAAAAQQASPQQGQGPGMMHGQGSGMPQGGPRAQSMPTDPASKAYMQGMRKMNRDMHKPMTGDADQDFARMMVTHHQGAIDMARVQLQYGTDPTLKAMAQKIVDDQTREIQQLQDWMKQHPAKQVAK